MKRRVNPGNPSTEPAVPLAAEGDGTRVVLVHSGWESVAVAADEELQGYANGREIVLAHYVSGAEH